MSTIAPEESVLREDTAVIICGCGPSGAVLSALLHRHNVPNVVLERETAVTTDPRGIALDEDGIRILQAVGIYDKVYTEIGSCMQRFQFVSGTKSDLSRPPIIDIDFNTSEGGTGHVGFLAHKQPALERVVRDQISDSAYSSLKLGCTVTGIMESVDKVTVTYTDADNEVQNLSGLFLVGADGKTGYVRKQYLEPRGVLMEQVGQTSYEATWVALNWQISLPTPATHPDFPLWQLGLTPHQVYDLFFPENFRFLCNPLRPAVCGRFGLPEDRLWRFEFVVQDGEDGHQMAELAETSKIIYPYITHDGSRYGLRGEVQFPPDCIMTLRSRPFYFSARSCNVWAEGRVILVGDAAHVFPPFGGQGIVSGFRDVLGLAWRLALLYRGDGSIRHEALLRAWYIERKQQFNESLAVTIRNGNAVTEANRLKILWRDWSLWALQLVPSWKRKMERGARAVGMTRYRARTGLPFLASFGGGVQLPQVYVHDFSTSQIMFSDDLIFSKAKTRLFQLVLLPQSTEGARELVESVHTMNLTPSPQLSWQSLIDFGEMTVVVHRAEASQPHGIGALNKTGISLVRVATAEEFARSKLCIRRPPPIYYDPYRMLKEVDGKPLLIVRPDRYVFAACSDISELSAALECLRETVHLSETLVSRL